MRYVSALMINLAFVVAFASDALAMAGQPGGGAGGKQGGSMLGLILPMAIVFAIFYLLLIRPQQKQQKKVKAMLESIQRGDEVVTRSGIHGKIHGIAENIVTLEIADNVRIKIGREHIGLVKGKEAMLQK